MILENKFEIGEIVYLITDPDQKKRIVTSIQITPGNIKYHLSQCDNDFWAEEFEISRDRDLVKLTDN
jgi:hypothetical protein